MLKRKVDTMEVVASSLGKRVVAARMQRGVNQAELARMIKLSPKSMVAIELGYTKDPGFSIMLNIADALGVSLDTLAGRD